MLSKFAIVLTVLIIICSGIYYFLFTPSYQKSVEARVAYLLEDYEEAYRLSKEAYNLQNYNKMAFTIMNQSKIAMQYEKYINDAQEYLQKIELISAKEKFTQEDKLRVKMMCEIMIDAHKKLAPTKLTSENLIDEAHKGYQRFENLYNELFLKAKEN